MAASGKRELVPDALGLSATLSSIGFFEKEPVLAVAVSGGADSMALLLAAHDWAQKHDGKVIGLTVDHGLREESTKEAQQVSKWCKTYGIEHHILNWDHETKSSAQADARSARYNLLAGWCKQHNILHLLTAHHEGDQAETLFFRLARSSGLDGLAGMSTVSTMQGVRLIRPLLDIPKSVLEGFLRERGQKWIEDPSNQNTKYTRVAIRKQLPAELCARAANLCKSFGHIRHTREIIEAEALPKLVYIYPAGYGTICANSFSELSLHVKMRMLGKLIQTLNNEPYKARSEKLEQLANELNNKTTRITCARLIFHYLPKKEQFLIYREPAKLPAPQIIKPNKEILWDGRFMLSHNANIELELRPLGHDGIAYIKNNLSAQISEHQLTPQIIAFPSFWRVEQLVSVPHMAYSEQKYHGMRFIARFLPSKALAGGIFFHHYNRS